MNSRFRASRPQISRVMMFIFATVAVGQAEASRCLEALNRKLEPEATVPFSVADVAQVQTVENKVRVLLQQGNWSQKTNVLNTEGPKSSLEGRVEKAHRLRALLQEQARSPVFQETLQRPEGHVEIDLSAVDRISSEVLGTLLSFQKFLLISYPTQGGVSAENGVKVEKLRLVGVRPDVYSFIKMSAMDKVLDITVAP